MVSVVQDAGGGQARLEVMFVRTWLTHDDCIMMGATLVLLAARDAGERGTRVCYADAIDIRWVHHDGVTHKNDVLNE